MDHELNEFWQKKLDGVLEMLKNRGPITEPKPWKELPPIPRVNYQKEKVAKFRIEERGKKDGWTHWRICKDHRVWGYADTYEEACRMIREEGYAV